MEELPPDQRAALSLLLRQRKSYAEVATLLQIPAGAVHDRAQAALAVLAPGEARALTRGARERGRRLPARPGGHRRAAEDPHLPQRLRTGPQLGLAVASELPPLTPDQLPGDPAAPANNVHLQETPRAATAAAAGAGAAAAADPAAGGPGGARGVQPPLQLPVELAAGRRAGRWRRSSWRSSWP